MNTKEKWITWLLMMLILILLISLLYSNNKIKNEYKTNNYTKIDSIYSKQKDSIIWKTNVITKEKETIIRDHVKKIDSINDLSVVKHAEWLDAELDSIKGKQ